MKTVITHVNPDLDAITSVWLIKKFLPDWQDAKVKFTQAIDNSDPLVDADPEVLYVDVGRGKLDHHQTADYLSATRLVFDFIKQQRKGQVLSPSDQEALQVMVETVTEIDNACDLSWPESKDFRSEFYLHWLLSGLRGTGKTDPQVVKFGFLSLDVILHNLKVRIEAQKEIKQRGKEFETPWGKAVALETGNESTLREGEKVGYVLVIKRNPDKGGIRIYARHDSPVNLKNVFTKLKKIDNDGDWFLHASGRILLNESRTKEMKPTKLTLEQVVEVLKND